MAQNMNKLSKHVRKYKYVLMVMRHAKAESALSGEDADRNLNDKGKKQAKRMAKGLKSLDMIPQEIICSGVVRTRQTLDSMLKVFGDKPQVAYRQSLYEGGKAAVMDQLSAIEDSTHSILVIGHEPSVSMVCGKLATRDSSSSLLAQLSVGVSNATIIILGSDKPFNQWNWHEEDLVAILSPKDFK